MSDARIEAFLADVLALEGEGPRRSAMVCISQLADCGQIYRAQGGKGA